VRLVHDTGTETRPIATDVDVADTLWTQFRGLMGKTNIPEGYGMYFPFDTVRTRGVHMMFVRTRLDVVWIADSEVTRTATLSPWIGHGRARCDTFVELPPGTASDIAVGDGLRLDER
jgi:uncharacterized membrane protein (UPF0127 family)